MRKSESLLLLCTKIVTLNIINGDYDCTNVFELPPDLFDFLVIHLPPLALEKLHKVLNATGQSLECNGWHDVEDECSKSAHKRARIDDPNNDRKISTHRKNIFNETWRALFKSRWPHGIKQITASSEDGEAKYVCNRHSKDWQYVYWETHLQNCIDEVAAVAVLPTFQGNIGAVKISDAILEHIGCRKGQDHSAYDYSTLSYHCQQFGCYARYLKLQNVFCAPETCVLLRNSKLHQLVFRGIKSKSQVDGICKILNQNKETLISLEFLHCKLSMDVLSDICGSLYTESAHSIMCLSIKSSGILFDQVCHSPTGFLSFLASRRSFCSLDVSHSGLEPTFARMILDTLISSSSNISALELSDNRISGWLAPHAAAGSASVCSNSNNCLRLLQVLNLRGNGLGREDAEDLKSTFMYMPNLKRLDISDNPLEDDGVWALVSYFTEHPEFSVDDMNMENCGISGVGVVGILDGLSTLGKPFRSLSIAHNSLGRSMAVPLSTFLSKCRVQRLNIEATGLGPSGFDDLEKALPSGLALEYLNISKNRGRLSTALFLSKLLVHSPGLVEVDAGYNFMPIESVSIIHAALKASKGKLKRVDLTGNMHLFKSPVISVLDEFHHEGEPIVVLSLSLTSMTPHDDDP
ncbi:uncharacterized protein LOC116253424 isoform X2 [Nymphaea colorata]|uniref:uncharacterized protein LOC116253424 isoform X2 n=1 Tax=Nymphaea colorata TaxID=210225 RepID=UPI00129DF88C|nr:uncharacterized protein LOC116253424 isoform X2 [Nymphaea colorata]